MQRVTFKNSRGLTLVGNFSSAESKKIIILVHGFTGDKSEGGKFDKLTDALLEKNFNVLAFDFSGCGESDDDPLTVTKENDDLRCAIEFILQKGLSPIGIMGYSLGALVTANVWDKKMKTTVFWSPVTNSHPDVRSRFSPEQLEELKKTGLITRIKAQGVRKKYVIDGKLLEERSHIDQKELLRKIKCPVLIIHGDQDQRVPLADSQRAMQYLPIQSRIEIIEGADHYFKEKIYEDRFVKLTADWFSSQLP
jgi:pimeloyl-ACP methyl ester carboxylesterase